MSSSAPPATEPPVSRSLFAGPGEQGRWVVWRAAVEAVTAAALVLLAHEAVSAVEARLVGEAAGLAVLGIVLVLMRRRFPAACVVGLAALMGAVPSVALLTAVAAYTAARQLRTSRQRVGVLLGAAALTMLTGAVCAPALGVGSSLFGLALGAVLAVTTVVVPGLVGTAAGQQGRLLRALRERAAAAGHEPPRPPAATECLYPYASERPEGGRLPIVRYCFRSDTLIAIDRFTVPMVTEPHSGSTTHD
ncbi:hypothetical protein [Streptomyces sp. RPA4-5]|uniref:hypothetical protein n=1 Tax=Streptomyces sp. RPA4-5 TaxID=2721245 RepID=UPI001B3C9618|nr:hypothetical protein [Streptomyces sp. RPA4-5]